MRRFLPCLVLAVLVLAVLVLAVLALAGCGTSAPQGENPPSVSFAGVAHESRLTKLPRRTGSPHVYRTVASPFVGEIFTATTGKWRNTPTSYAYQWERCVSGSCSSISGATTSSYTVVTADEGHKLRVTVTASNSFGSASAHSAETGEVPSVGGCTSNCIFFAQSGKGAESGAECSSAHSVAWLNEAGNWASTKTAGKVSPGYTAALCGTITEAIIVRGSGKSGEPITLQFQPGAKIALGGAVGCPSTGCVNLGTSTEYVNILGASSTSRGVIENTERGAERTFHGVPEGEKGTTGIQGAALKHVTIEDVEVANLYVPKEGESEPIGNTEIRGLLIYSSSEEPEYVTINHDVFHDLGWAINETFNGSAGHDYIEYDTLYHDAHGIVPSGSSEGGGVGPVVVAHNHFYADGPWSTNPGLNHMDGLHCYTGNKEDGTPGLHWTGLYIYDNTITMEGEYGVTAPVYLEGKTGPQCGDATSKIWVFNNVLTGKGAGTLFALNNGLLSPYAGEERIFNDTFIGNKTTEGSCVPLGNPSSEAAGILFRNNVLTNCRTLIEAKEVAGKLTVSSIDYNLYAEPVGSGNEAFRCTGHEYFLSGFAEWKTNCLGATTGADAHSKTASTAKLESSEPTSPPWTLGKPEAGSEALGNGVNLKATCETIGVTAIETACEQNINGEARSVAGAWNIGAY